MSEAPTHELPVISPDIVEQNYPEEMDNIIPTRGYQMLPIVGLGGSAGSISALQEFFRAMPVDSRMAFVVILHLSPEHESTMADLLQRTTEMRVVQAKDAEKVEPNWVYVIPPGKHLASIDGYLRLTELQPWRGKRVAVDLFFRTLADTHGPHASAIILSGADGDGSIGIKRVKERGGLTIVQDPSEAEHPGMPRSAIATGMVDWILRVADMPQRLLEYHRNEHRVQLPPEDGPPPVSIPGPASNADEAALREVLAYVKMRTGRDFASYKRATILRRISRRMQVNNVHDLPGYLDYLRLHAGESGALLQDLLISVTNFFRDRESFAALEARIPDLFAGKTPRDHIRVWVAACATGEEAYSVAMLLMEHAAKQENPPSIQVFATDLDEEAVHAARQGVFTEAIAADVSEERLRRFFIKEPHGYRLRREVRELVLFAAHDVLSDSPFSRLDLISCRNLLIYLNREAQVRVFDIFHFALLPGGRLFLGSSESIEDGSPLYTVLDKKHRIYQQVPVARLGLPVPAVTGTLARALEARNQREGPAITGAAFQRASALTAGMFPVPREEARVSWSELHFRLIEHFSPPSVIVNRQYDVLHLSENAGRFLHYAGGEPTMNLLHIAHPMLRIELRSALYRAAESGETVEVFRVPMEVGEVRYSVDIRVSPGWEVAPEFLLVVFDARRADAALEAPRDEPEPEPAWRHLERELEGIKAQHRDIIEQYEASTEELKASNEELHAMNEELRSATEELETGREELQSINEELTTVNSELKSKVDELAKSNSDLHNLMAATAIASVFLDRAFCITRYTPAAAPLFNLIASDVGRPLNDLKHRLDYPEMLADAESVLARLVPIEREVRSNDSRTYLARLHPYRTTDDRIAGVVLSFIDTTEGDRAKAALRESEGRYRTLVEQVKDYAIFMIDLQGRATSWNEGVRRVLGFDEAEFIGVNTTDRIFTPEDVADGIPQAELAEATATGSASNDRWMRRNDGSRFWAAGITTSLRDDYGRPIGFTKVMRDQTEIKEAEEELARVIDESERARRMHEAVLSTIPDLVFVLDRKHRLSYANGALLGMVGMAPEQAVGKHIAELGYPLGDADHQDREIDRIVETGQPIRGDVIFQKDGERRIYDYILAPILGADGEVEAIAGSSRDVTDRKGVEDALKDADRKKDQFLATLAHELRNPLAPIRNSLTVLRKAGEAADSVEALAIMERQVDHMVRLVDDLMEISRITNGKIELRRRSVGIAAVVRQAIEISRPLIEAAGHELRISIPADAPVVDADPVRLSQVIANLLNNAAKYAEPGGIIRLGVRHSADEVAISVHDEGVGIPPEMLTSIFDIFTQVDRDRKLSNGGLGIGLSLAKGLIEMHGGSIEARSAGIGQGSEFIVRLPISPHARTVEEAKRPARVPESTPSGLRILVVDDNYDSAKSLGKILKLLGNDVRIANDGPKALEMIAEFSPSIAFLDLGMPEMNGYEVARQIREGPLGKAMILVALTGWGREEDLARTKVAGFDAHYIKPIDLASLEQLLRSLSHPES